MQVTVMADTQVDVQTNLFHKHLPNILENVNSNIKFQEVILMIIWENYI